MNTDKLTVLCVGATGSVGRHVVEEALRRGHAVRALVRSRARAAGLPAQAQIVVGELTQPDTLAAAVEGVDAIVFTHGSNGDKADNRIANLRIGTKADNGQNQREAHVNSQSKTLGVCWNKRLTKWVAQIKCNGKVRHLGLFSDKTEAAEAYAKAKRELHPFCTL